MSFLCSFKAFLKKTKDDLSPKEKKDLYNKMMTLHKNWDTGKGFENVKQMGYNNFETFEFIYKKYTKKPSYDMDQFPMNYKDYRKLLLGLKTYNQKLSHKRNAWQANLHLPKQSLQNFPELQKFERELTFETSYFRDYSTETSRAVDDILNNFKTFSASMGAKTVLSNFLNKMSVNGIKEVRRIQSEYDALVKAMLQTSNPNKLNQLKSKYYRNRTAMKQYYQTGAGESIKILNQVLLGVDINTIPNLSNPQKSQLQKIRTNYNLIRKEGSTSLIRGLQQIGKMAKDKNLLWVDSIVDKVNGLIKQIEFQKSIDDNGRVIDHKNFTKVKDFLSLGIVRDKNLFGDGYEANGKVAFSEHYMSQYALGLVKTLTHPEYGLEKLVERGNFKIDKRLEIELNNWDSIINVAKGKSAISNPVYDADPYFFLKKYVSDVGMFNYRTHVKSTFKKATDAVTKEHLNVARREGRKDLESTAEDMLNLMEGVYKEISKKDITQDSAVNDMMRIMTSVTYFRLMGGNIRSAVRNGTQRLWEFVEWGAKAKLDARSFYHNSGITTDNVAAVNRQMKKFGLQWFDPKNKEASLGDYLKKGQINLSERSRGALEDSYIHNSNRLYINTKGELTIKESEGILAKPARGASIIAGKSGVLHRIVEDWNRSGTFKTAFALAFGNLQQTNKSWQVNQFLKDKNLYNKILEKKGKDYIPEYNDLVDRYGAKTEAELNRWMENKAGRMAYNGTVDLHFEYAKWNKSNAIRANDENSRAVQFAKTGIGQFAHYRFNMVNLMFKWMKEAGISYKAFDFTSEEALKPIRMGILQATMFASTVAFKTNFMKLFDNDVLQTGQAMWTWMSGNRELWRDGKISDETKKAVDAKTYGQGGWYFLGPNVSYALSLAELAAHSERLKNPIMDQIFDTATEKAVVKDANQELYQKIARYNAAAARFGAYTTTAFSTGGLRDAMWLGLGLFPTKEQRDLNTWVQEGIGWKEKKKKKFKPLKERLNEKGIENRLQKDLLDKDKILKSLDLLR